MATLFEEAKIKDLVLRNRTIRSATYEGMADREGHVTDRMINLYRELAAGGAALIFPGPVYAEPGGQAYLRQISIVDDTCREGLINLVKAIHSYGALAGLNISHAGLFRDEKDLPGDCVGPVVSEDVKRSHMLSPGEIKQIEKNFTYAAKKGKQVGFDCVQVHAAHGYLLSEFISPAINTRTDEYGGSVENRARFACEIIDSIRQETSPSYPILAKLNTDDFLEGGLTIDDAIYTARLMNEAGLDAIELTGGTMFYLSRLFKRHSATSAEQEGYYRKACSEFRKQLSIPVILTGGVRSFEGAQNLIYNGICDFVGFNRPLTCEPNLIRHWAEGYYHKSGSTNCNGCVLKAAQDGLLCQYRMHRR